MQRPHLATATCGALALTIAVSLAGAATAPQGFVIDDAFPSVALNRPTSFAFTPDGRVLIAEKRGVVRVIENGIKLPQYMWDAETEVLNKGDRGLLGITVDPDYLVNRWVYLIYSVDPDSNGLDNHENAFGRITRYQTSLADPNVFDLSTRQVLIGRTWADGFPSASQSHAIGALRWGTDGSLFASCGDGAQFSFPDTGGRDPEMFLPGRLDPSEDIGVHRAQYLGSLAGKVLRINPETGCGYTSNPYFDGNLDSNPSRIWAYGLRNPYRLAFRPGSGSTDTSMAQPGVLAMVDVGWNSWEEINLATAPGQNFGWPCFEGPVPQPLYHDLVTTHLDCSSMGTTQNPGWHRPPTISWHHSDSSRSIPSGIVGLCGGGATFYQGTQYPANYHGALFISDFVYNWIAIATFDANHELEDVTTFGTDTDGPVDFVADPVSGDIHFLAYKTGRFCRIRFTPALSVGPARYGLALSVPYPNPSTASVSLTVELPREETVRWSVLDPSGREVWRAPVERYPAGRGTLVWSGMTSRGVRARPGLYFVHVRAGETGAVRRLAMLR